LNITTVNTAKEKTGPAMSNNNSPSKNRFEDADLKVLKLQEKDYDEFANYCRELTFQLLPAISRMSLRLMEGTMSLLGLVSHGTASIGAVDIVISDLSNELEALKRLDQRFKDCVKVILSHERPKELRSVVNEAFNRTYNAGMDFVETYEGQLGESVDQMKRTAVEMIAEMEKMKRDLKRDRK
jgi:hypothetical protein